MAKLRIREVALNSVEKNTSKSKNVGALLDLANSLPTGQPTRLPTGGREEGEAGEGRMG